MVPSKKTLRRENARLRWEVGEALAQLRALHRALKENKMPPQIDLDKTFRYHPPTENQKSRCSEIRRQGKVFSAIVSTCTLQSAEQTLAIRKIQEAVMWANAAIAINEPDAEAVVPDTESAGPTA